MADALRKRLPQFRRACAQAPADAFRGGHGGVGKLGELVAALLVGAGALVAAGLCFLTLGDRALPELRTVAAPPD